MVLFQLPPNFRRDLDVLKDFLAELPHNVRYAFEFRHVSWHDDGVYQLLREHNASLCLAESEKLEAPEIITADFVYFRLRKPDYTEEDRAAIWQRVERLLSEKRAIFLFFKHEDTPEGAVYAEEMLQRSRS